MRVKPGTAAKREKVGLRRAAAWGAQKWPEWFARGAPVVIGLCFALVLGRTRRRVRRNLELIHGSNRDRIRTKYVFRTFVEFARALTAGLAPERPLFRDRALVIEGAEEVSSLRKKGEGMLMLTAHVGPWDACASRLRRRLEVPVMMIMSPESDESAGAFQDDLREASDVRVIRVGESPLDVLPVVEHVRNGGIVVAQMDRVPAGSSSLSTPLFGLPFAFPAGVLRMAGALGCPIIPVFAARLDAERDLVRVHPAIRLSRRPNQEESKRAAARATSCLEAHLRQFPTQWFHFVD